MGTSIAVRLQERSYAIQIGRGLLRRVGETVAELGMGKGKACAIITDTQVGPHYGAILSSSLEAAGIRSILLTVPSGEKSKSLGVAEALLEKMAAARLDRSSLVVALGGGVVGDLAGFVAAIYMRGLPYIQIPTTVLAQVDSSVGGKTGVNLTSGKNLAGCFHQPSAVLADVDTLQTLPARELSSGFAEIIKHALIRDAAMFEDLQSFTSDQLESIIRRNIEIKAAIVSADEHELTGERALLNFGHTIGHGIEAAAGYGSLLHGEAISLGIIAAARLSPLAPATVAAIISVLEKFQLPTRLPDSIASEAILAALRRDKKFVQGSIRFILLRKIGEAFLSDQVSLGHIQEQIELLRLP